MYYKLNMLHQVIRDFVSVKWKSHQKIRELELENGPRLLSCGEVENYNLYFPTNIHTGQI